MLALDGVSGNGGSVLFHGLDVSQTEDGCIFYNETFMKMHVALRETGKPAIAFELESGKDHKLQNIVGEYDLSVVHIIEFMDLTILQSGKVMAFAVTEVEVECAGHGTKLQVTALTELDLSVPAM